MPIVRLPSEHDPSYPPARGTVLLLTCMDLRFLDEIVQFMDHDNLGNRYDHVIFAGAALGALGAPGAKDEKGQPLDFGHWKRAFEDHLGAAIELHGVEDIYILEHRNCGAYHKVFRVCEDFGDSPADREAEEKCHLKYAVMLEKEIAAWAAAHGKRLRTHKFLMDLRGNVSVLPLPKPKTPPRRVRKKP
jgi:hypothetical protein